MTTQAETWEELALRECQGTCAGLCPMSRPAGLCKDCVQDGQPTGLMFPGLTERCPGKRGGVMFDSTPWFACTNDCYCLCHGTGRTLLQGPALLVAGEGELERRGQYNHSYHPASKAHKYTVYKGEEMYPFAWPHDADRYVALRLALAAVAGGLKI